MSWGYPILIRCCGMLLVDFHVWTKWWYFIYFECISSCVAGHIPINPYCTSSICLAWNYKAALAVIYSHHSVVCFLAGHLHYGGYCLDSHGVHHLTLEGIIETPPESNAFGTIYVYNDRLVLKGNGRVPDREMYYKDHPHNSLF